MNYVFTDGPMMVANVLELVKQERRVALSDREWAHRLKGYGYRIRQTEAGRVVENLMSGSEVCALPADFA